MVRPIFQLDACSSGLNRAKVALKFTSEGTNKIKEDCLNRAKVALK